MLLTPRAPSAAAKGALWLVKVAEYRQGDIAGCRPALDERVERFCEVRAPLGHCVVQPVWFSRIDQVQRPRAAAYMQPTVSVDLTQPSRERARCGSRGSADVSVHPLGQPIMKRLAIWYRVERHRGSPGAGCSWTPRAPSTAVEGAAWLFGELDGDLV